MNKKIFSPLAGENRQMVTRGEVGGGGVKYVMGIKRTLIMRSTE